MLQTPLLKLSQDRPRRYPPKFGRMVPMNQTVRDSRAGIRFERVWQDLSYGARRLRRSPGFSIMAIFVLSLEPL